MEKPNTQARLAFILAELEDMANGATKAGEILEAAGDRLASFACFDRRDALWAAAHNVRGVLNAAPSALDLMRGEGGAS